MHSKAKIVSHSPEETVFAGFNYAGSIKPGDVIGLFGNLGSGKTRFIKGICEYFGVREIVNSPTFIIVNEYECSREGPVKRIYHFDLYRIQKFSELKEVGPESYMTKDAICLFEWAEKAEDYFEMKKIVFEYGEKESDRIISFQQ